MNSKVLLKIIDSIKGENVLKRYLFFLDTLNWSKSQVQEYQMMRLNELIKHSITNVPYYRQNYKDLIKGELKDLSQLKEWKPISRDDIRNNELNLIDERKDRKKLLKGSSSGTTGIPINYYNDKAGHSAGTAAGLVLQTMAGRLFGEKSVHIWGNQTSIQRWETPLSKFKNELIKKKNVASSHLDDPKLMDPIIKDLIKYKPLHLDGYSSSIYTLAQYIESNGIKLSGLKSVITTAENLEPYQSKVIEKNLGTVSDLYGCSEILGIAMRPYPENKYFIFDPHVLVEVEEREGLKEILVTDLDNYAMPLIRYKIGDLIDGVHQADEGSKYPFTWFEKIHGRSSDIITLPNGKKFHPVNIFGGTLFRNFKEIKRHKAIWDGNKMEFVFEADRSIDLSLLESEIKKILQPYEVSFTITITDKILPSASGKYQYMEIKMPGR